MDDPVGTTSWFAKRPVRDVRPGDHAWLAYSGAEERDKVIETFVDEGLNTNEKVVYVTDLPPADLPGMRTRVEDDLLAHMRSSQLRVIPYQEACLDSAGRFAPDKMADTIATETGQAFDQGFRAVRITTDYSWLLRGPRRRSDLTQMLGCEHLVNDAVAPSTMAMAICQVGRRLCKPDELVALRDTHEVLVEVDPEYHDHALKIVRTFDPPGLRLEGELDVARHAVFDEKLHQVASGGRPIHLDFSGLSFIDLGGLHLLTRHATALSPGRSLILDGLPPDVEAIIEMVGWRRLPGLAPGRPRPQPRTEGRSA